MSHIPWPAFFDRRHRRSSILFAPLAALLVMALVFSGLTVLTPSAKAANGGCSATYSNLQWKAGSAGVEEGVYRDRYSSAELEFDWAANPDVKAGDTFRIDLPNQLATVGTGELKIYDQENKHVATALIGVETHSVEFVFTDAVEDKFNVRGTAHLTVKWWRGDEDMVKNGFGTESDPGNLEFSGCGEGSLLGFYAPDVPFDVTQRSDLTGVGLETIQVNGKEVYSFPWTIFVGSQTGTTEFSVVTTPPAGQKFACSGDYAQGYAPVSLEALRNQSNTDQPLHYIIDGEGNDVSGRNNLTGVVNEQIPEGDGYIVDCSEDKLTVTFPHGVHPKTGPRINLITFTDKKPKKDSVVTLKALVKDTEVSGSVTVDSAGGDAEGDKGGFVLQKTVEGLPASANKEYSFDWKCGSEADSKSGTAKLKANESEHVAELAKGAHCTVTEKPAPESGYEHTTKWDIEGVATTGNTVEFDIRKPDEEAIAISAKNTYTPTGTFQVTKKVVAESNVAISPDKKFKIDYTCEKDGVEPKTGSLVVKANEVVQSPEIPAGFECAVKEDEASAKVEGAEVNIVNGQSVLISKNSSTVQTITVTNTYKSSVGSFKIVKNVNGLPADKSKPYSFDYTCTKDGAEVARGAREIVGSGDSLPVEGIPVGATCAVSENTDAAKVAGYSLVVDEAKPVVITAGGEEIVTVNNTYSKDLGSFSVTKKLVDPDGVATGKSFTFDYKCVNEELGEIKEGTLGPIAAGEEETVDEIAAGSTCTITERYAGVDGADLKPTGIDHVTIVKNEIEEVTVTNEYSAWRANVRISKELLGSAAEVDALKDKKFDVDYTCTLGTDVKSGTVQVSANEPATIEGVRSGAGCTFAEKTEGIEVAGTTFDKAGSITNVDLTVGGNGSTAEVSLKNKFDQLGKIALTKVVGGFAAGSSNLSSQNPREFDIEASWKDAATGETVTKQLKIYEGTLTELDALPVGTVVKLKEIMPENNALVSWSTPGYTSQDGKLNLIDNGDGTASVVVPADSATTPAVIEVHNTANVPWWWIFILVPFIPPLLSGSSSSGSSEGSSVTTTVQPAPSIPAQPTSTAPVEPGKEAPKSLMKKLANTGVQLGGVVGIGAMLLLAGFVFVNRRKKD